jgi:hypothetical protein
MDEQGAPNKPMSRRWLWVLGLIAAIDLAIRFGVAFRMRQIATGEALLFASGAIALGLMWRRTPPPNRYGGHVQIALALALALAAERATLWRAGAAMSIANLTTLVTALVVFGIWFVRRRTSTQARQT